MYAATMMKRSGVGSVYDSPAPTVEQKVPVSNAPADTKVLWLTDATALVGPREEEARRKGPEMKFLYAISACLTIMVLWGIFRELHLFVPQVFRGSADSLAQQDTIDRIQTGTNAFQADSVAIGGRKGAKHLLEVQTERFVERQPRLSGILKDLDKQQQTDLAIAGGRKILRGEGRHVGSTVQYTG